MIDKKLAIVAGVGQGLGEAICKELSADGYHVVALARNDEFLNTLKNKITNEGGMLTPITCDLLNESSITQAFDQIKALGIPISVYIHNASQFVMDDYLKLTTQSFDNVWRLTCLSAFQCTQHVLPDMIDQKNGTIILTGATAAVRGGAKFAAFASAKFALRGLSQSLAREFSSQGIHVAHVILDGIIYCDWTKERFGVEQEKALLPEDIAKNYLFLINQRRSTWTQELDLRPDNEDF